MVGRRLITLRTYTWADLAESDAPESDPAMIVTGGKDTHGNIIFFEQWRKVGSDSVEIMSEVIRQMRRYKCSGGYIEKNRFESIMRTCNKLVDAGLYGKPEEVRNITRKITLVPHYVVSKLTRIKDNVGPRHRAHNIWVPSTWQNFKDFFIRYPAVDHDEEGDVMEMAVSWGRPPSRDVVDVVSEAEMDYKFRGTGSTVSINEYFAKQKINIWTGHAKTQRKSREVIR